MTTVAFFDLDYTLLNTSSGILYLQEIVKQRRAPLWTIGYLSLGYRLKRFDLGETHSRLMQAVGRRGQQDTLRFFEEWVNRRLLSHLTQPGRDKIAWHQSQGHRVVINSASIGEIVRPVAAHLGLGEDYLCTLLAAKNDRYLGQVEGPVCYGSGKVDWAKRWLAENDLPFPASIGYVYTDSSSDLPLLELAQHPIAVNPSRKLSKIAKDRGWRVERFY